MAGVSFISDLFRQGVNVKSENDNRKAVLFLNSKKFDFLKKDLHFLLRSVMILNVPNGVWRSLVARTAGGREVAGSNPVAPMKIKFSKIKSLERLH